MSIKRLLLFSFFVLLLESASFTLLTPDATAIPVFARKYNMTCNGCHTAFPKLNAMGIAFRERGYRMVAGRADISAQAPKGGNTALGENAVVTDSLPITLRTQISYATAEGGGHGGLGGVEGAGEKNPKFGVGEYGLISSGSYDNFSWWADANLDEVEMMEGQWYFSDLFKLRFGNVQNNVGYGMTMMSARPLGAGTDNFAISANMGMLAMATGIGVNGTTDGASGMGTAYNFSYHLEGKPSHDLADTNTDEFIDHEKVGSATFARVSQSFMGHNIGLYSRSASNIVMQDVDEDSGIATTMFTETSSRTGIDFAVNYGQPFQVWGAITSGKDTIAMDTAMEMDMMGTPTIVPMQMDMVRKISATTVNAEYMMSGGLLVGLKYDSLITKDTVMNETEESSHTNTTYYFLKQLAENLQLSLASTATKEKEGDVTDSVSTYNLTLDFAL